MPYAISKSTDLNTVIERTSTIDVAFIRVGELSKDRANFGTVFVAWHWEDVDGKAEKRCRAYGQAGRSRWAKACTAAADRFSGTHYMCRTCGGLGLIEDAPL